MSGKEKGDLYARGLTVSGDHGVFPYAPGASKTNFTIDLGTNVQKINQISFVSIAFRNNAYNIISSGPSQNNLFGFTINGDGEYSGVNQGWWTTTQLMQDIQAQIQYQLDAAGFGQTITITQDSKTQLVSIVYDEGTSGNPTMLIGKRALSDGPGAWDLLGFDVSTGDITIQSGVATVATNLPSLGGLSTVFLKSDALAPGMMFDVHGEQKNYCLAIPITAQFGYMNTFECKDDVLCTIQYPTARNLQRVDFALVDKDGNLVDMHGANLIINMKIWFQRY